MGGYGRGVKKMKKEILTESEKETFEKYINFMLQNGFKKEEFEFTKIPNPNPYVLRVKAESFIKNMNVENCALEGMALGKTYTWEELGLYASKDILSDKEKEYLSAVIKPFRDKVDYVKKYSFDGGEKESIGISFKNDNGYFSFPVFKKGTMYAGMYPYREYTLEELGL